MKIALPAQKENRDSEISSVLGRAPYFLILDQKTDGAEFVENTATQRPGGAGVQAAQLLVDQGVQVVITPQCGANALLILQGAKIELYQSIAGSLNDNISAFAEGELQPLAGAAE